jgi:hypothetical protein
MRWFWTSRGLLVQQQAWLGLREYDARQPTCHYNLHIQPVCGGPDYHNYHIRYLLQYPETGLKKEEFGITLQSVPLADPLYAGKTNISSDFAQRMREGKHIWSVVDAPGGKEKSHRVYTFSKKHFIQEVIDTASYLLVTDISNDVGDPSLWARLAEDLAFVLFDLYRDNLEKTCGRIV